MVGFPWQRGYIEGFIDAVRAADWTNVDWAKRSVVDTATKYLEGEQLRFLLELSIEPVAARVDSVRRAAG